MKKRTTTQNRILYSLLSSLGISDDNKAVLVAEYTNGRTEKSSEMSYNECQQLIDDLQREERKNRNEEYKKLNRLRRKVFVEFYELGWLSQEATNGEKTAKINAFLTSRTKFGKSDINKLTEAELSKLITQLRTIKRQIAEKEKPACVATNVDVLVENFDVCLN